MKWAVVGDNLLQKRYELLSKFLNDQGLSNAVEFIPVDKEINVYDLKTLLSQLDNTFEVLHFSEFLCGKVVHCFERNSSSVYTMQTATSCVRKESTWWLENFLYDGLKDLMSEGLFAVDLLSSVFIIGTNWAAKTAVAVFVRVGYKKIRVTDRFNERGKEFIDEMRKKYFSVEFEFVPVDSLTLVSGNHQILFNTVSENEDEELVSELSYFNYMTKGGAIFDFNQMINNSSSDEDSLLLKGAKSVDVHSFSHSEILFWLDLSWMKTIKNVSISREEYQNFLKSNLG